MENDNVENVCKKIDSNLKRWSRRNLSILGKILIVKTFGISQLIFLLQSMSLKNAHMTVLKAYLYKFIWNRHYMASKAPERIKRTIVDTPVKLGGLGMLDIAQLDAGLKIKALGRLQTSEHPFMKLIKEKVNISEFFFPNCPINIDSVIESAVTVLKSHRNDTLQNRSLYSNRAYLAAVGECKITRILSANGRNSLLFFTVYHRGKRKIKDLSPNELNDLRRYMRQDIVEAIENSLRLNRGLVDSISDCILIKGRFKKFEACSSKEIREALSVQIPIADFKIGMTLDGAESANWGHRLAKLTSIRHKSILLRVAHGDIYTKEKLNRFGLSDSNECPRCGQIETLRHKFIECPYVDQIWQHLLRLTNNLTNTNQLSEDRTKACLGALIEGNKDVLTINAEILTRILYLKSDQNFLLHPKKIIELALKLILRREQKTEIKSSIEDLLIKLAAR